MRLSSLQFSVQPWGRFWALAWVLSGGLAQTGCLVQDPAWEAPAETDADSTSGSSQGTSDVSSETGGATESTGAVPTDELPADCAPLPSVPADAIAVSPADNETLHIIFADAPPGGTIALEPGVYDRAGQPTLVVSAVGVTVRSTTGDPDDVVLAGGPSTVSLISVRASDVLLAEFTMRTSDDTLVDIGVDDAVLDHDQLYRMVMRDAAATKLDVGPGLARWTDDGVIACSTFEQGDAFRDGLSECGGVSAVRISGGARWTLRDNIFEGHWCTTTSYATVVADRGSSDTRVERNILKNNFRGILLGGDDVADGRPEPASDACGEPEGPGWGHVRGVIVNNVTWVDDPRMVGAVPTSDTDLDSMIGFWHVCGAIAVHNTSYVALTTFNGIEWRYADTSVTVANNLISTTLVSRDDGVALGVDHNVTGIGAAEFVDAAGGDFRLAPGSMARDSGIVIPAIPVSEDFDRNERTGRPDLGAFESQP